MFSFNNLSKYKVLGLSSGQDDCVCVIANGTCIHLELLKHTEKTIGEHSDI